MFETTAEAVLEQTPTGAWEVQVPVRALAPGPEGNILSGSITLMPQPVEGVEFVINRAVLSGGAGPEGDEELRQRAKRELRALGRATYTALKQSIEELPGVIRPVKIEEMPVPFTAEVDGEARQIPVPGVVRVIVDGGEEERIRQVIDETKAAGVYVELVRPLLALVDLKATIHVESGYAFADIEPSLRAALHKYIDSLHPGDDIIFGRLISTMLGVSGARDIEGLVIEVYREGRPMVSSSKENVVLDENEKARLRNVTLQTP